MKVIDSLYINGQWQKAHGNDTVLVTNPATEQTCVSIPKGDKVDVNAAVSAARHALPGWSATTAQHRAELMLAVACEMENRYQDLIDAHMETMGCPRHLAGDLHVDAAIEGMRYYASQAHIMDQVEERGEVLILKEAVGVCAFINPWNYPLHQLIGKVAPALAAGCTIIAKPAEQTPLQDLIMAEIFHKVGLPAGVFNLVFGSGREIGPLMSNHPQVDMVSFTGSTAAGIQVATAAAPTVKRVCQELGGKSALIITEDADLAAAIRYGVEDVMTNSGQTCNALTRMYLPASRYQEAVSLAQDIVQEQKVGDPQNETVTMGPLASKRQQETVLQFIRQGVDEGARLIAGGADMPTGLEKGAYVRPSIFADVTQEMSIAREEIFGPVLCMLAYDNIEQAIEMANDSVYGLSSGVYAKDKVSALKIARRLQAGQCYIQGSYFNMNAPFGGYKQSGNGREWGKEALHEYVETKAIICG
ncbi:aldehyde dehydrogenase family protein [uncultured Oceanisphaera sp.]|uniref:aldehyde dehydrogenase family protein n=1 Tax=uncultured Oceanisphaera sp. TaxID=353858 RepID=UPI00262C43F6|nr:aldehyde dehydrogenase family protein [uncultured Oceanisphaera sp.]